MLNKLDKYVGYTLLSTGIIQLVLLLAIMLGIDGDPFTKLLFNAFHVAALYLPALQFLGAYLILNKPLDRKLFYYAISSTVIFFPVASLLKIIFSDNSDPVVDFLHRMFDTPDREWGSIFILLCIIAILVLTSRITVRKLLVENSNSSEGHVDEIKVNPLELNTVDNIKETDVDDYYEVDEPEEVMDDLLETQYEDDIDTSEAMMAESVSDTEDSKHSSLDISESEIEEVDLSAKISEIKQEIKDYYTHDNSSEQENIPFEEPSFPECTDEVDIDALDKSNALLDDIVNIELTKEESDYLTSFDEVDTFTANTEELFEEDPGIAFLTNDEVVLEEEYTYESQISSNPGQSYVSDEVYQNSESKPSTENYYEEESSSQDIPVEEYDSQKVSSVEEYNSQPISQVGNYPDESVISGEYTQEVEEDNNLQGEHKEQRVLMPETPGYDELNQEVDYDVPVTGILGNNEDHSYKKIDEATKRSAAILEQTLEEFKIKGKVTGIKKGPVITMFELLPAPGVKLSKIVNLSDNIALGLAAPSVRIVAPIPGKHAVGIEVPNKKRAIVTFSELIEADEKEYEEGAVPIVLGKSINGDNKVIDLAKTPHMLIAGATGAGKSVCVNSLICSILCKRSHNDVKLIMVDPKIVELKLYNGIPHLLTPVITDPKRAFQAIQWCLYEMERRYALLDAIGVRDIKSYNKRIKEQKIATTKLPYLVLIVDEFADLMATSGKELEGILARLAAMSRAVGIHLVLATQRPSIDVITGLIKANFPSRIAFMVSSKTDSRIILDGMGAEKLLGKGDMLFTSSWDPFPVRVQGSFLSDEEVESVVDYVKGLGEPEYIDDEIFMDDDEESADEGENSFFGDDPLFNRALEIVITAGKASASFLQRRLKIGYNRAARLVEEMEERGIIGPQNGSKPREILKIPDSHREVQEFV